MDMRILTLWPGDRLHQQEDFLPLKRALTLAIGDIARNSGTSVGIVRRTRDATHLHVERLIAESINEGEDNHCDKRKSEMHQHHAGNKQHTVIAQIAVRAQGLFGRVRILPPICDQEWRRKGGSRSQDGKSCEEAQRSKHD